MILQAPHSVDNEINPWLAAEARFDEAAELLALDDGLRKVLRTPSLELTAPLRVRNHGHYRTDNRRYRLGRC